MGTKKIILILSCTLMICSVSSCGDASNNTQSEIDPVSVKVMSDIDSIGEVDIDDKVLIEKIERTYLTLTESQKEQVNNYAALLTARDSLDELIAAEEAEKKKEEEAKKKEEERQKTIDSYYTMGEAFCAKCIVALKNVLKNPESLQIIQYSVGSNESRDFFFTIEYSAQNGFGGNNRAFAIITDSLEYDQIAVIDSITNLRVITDSVFEEFGRECPTNSAKIILIEKKWKK